MRGRKVLNINLRLSFQQNIWTGPKMKLQDSFSFGSEHVNDIVKNSRQLFLYWSDHWARRERRHRSVDVVLVQRARHVVVVIVVRLRRHQRRHFVLSHGWRHDLLILERKTFKIIARPSLKHFFCISCSSTGPLGVVIETSYRDEHALKPLDQPSLKWADFFS